MIMITAAAARASRPVGGLDRRLVPVAASQLLACAISTAATAPDKPLDAAFHDALRDDTSDTEDDAPTLPHEIPPPPAKHRSCSRP